ncbi:hypothetical protein B296_00027521 [Ensete ventricosum]|uniref:Uncharacterized protein n=1 Tax=Ensete ventricosum TaxID=4639 RepID=A0A427AJM2_ENSVE|nr:hypothetical protein B296_00027521 [Ensete ventricosum]
MVRRRSAGNLTDEPPDDVDRRLDESHRQVGQAGEADAARAQATENGPALRKMKVINWWLMQKRIEERKTVMRRPTRVPTPQLRRATAPTRGRRRATLSRTPEVCSRPCLASFLGLCFVFWSIIYCGRRRREAASRPGLRTYPRRIASEVPGREEERRRRGRGKLGRGSAG